MTNTTWSDGLITMPIYYDPTEDRAGTRMPDNVLKAGRVLKGLEALTGADLLISQEESKLSDEARDTVPGRLTLRQHTSTGLLVQRKTGMDMLSSIPDLANIQAKMLEWTENIPPWLLLVGEYKPTRRGGVEVDGRASQWSYAAFQGALEKWQLRGGGVTILAHDSLVGPWVAHWHNDLASIAEDKLILPRKPTQNIITGVRDDPYAWRVTLATLPGIGPELATRIANYCGSLAMALCFLSDPAHIRFNSTTEYPKGLGVTAFAKAREWLGLDSSSNNIEVLVTACKSDIVGTGVRDSSMVEAALEVRAKATQKPPARARKVKET